MVREDRRRCMKLQSNRASKNRCTALNGVQRGWYFDVNAIDERSDFTDATHSAQALTAQMVGAQVPCQDSNGENVSRNRSLAATVTDSRSSEAIPDYRRLWPPWHSVGPSSRTSTLR